MKVANSGKGSVKKTLVILMFGIFILSFAGIMLSIFIKMATKTFRDEIKIELGGEHTSSETVLDYAVEALDLTPGNYKECKLVFHATVEGDFVVSVGFAEKEVGELRNYLNVEIFYQDKSLLNESLGVLFDSNKMTEIPVKAKVDEKIVITLRYLMPEETGNEAQGAFSKFDLLLSTAFAK